MAGDDGDARVARDGQLHAGADEGRVGADKRNRLTLHVRAHECAVCVVVLKEGDEGRSNRDKLVRRDIHQGDLGGRQEGWLTVRTAGDAVVVEEGAIGLELGGSLGDVVLLFVERGEPLDRLTGRAIGNTTVGRLDEAVLVDAGEGRERGDKTDVRSFRRLNRADTTVVGRVNVADLEASALAGQTAGPEGRKATLVGNLRQGVGLVHELRELAGAKILFDDGRDRLGVDEVVGHEGVELLALTHALLDGPLHADKADAVLIL